MIKAIVKMLLVDFQQYLFDPNALRDGNPPNDRGCRACGKIGVSNQSELVINLSCINI